MKIFAASIAALSLIAAAAPAAAEPAVASSASASASETSASGGQAHPSKAERKFCKRFENSARRTQAMTLCLTREEWKKFDASQDD